MSLCDFYDFIYFIPLIIIRLITIINGGVNTMESLLQTPDYEARSPWAVNDDKRLVKISPPGAPISGNIRLLGSKSLTNRALVIAALAEGTSRINGILRSDDSYWCMDCLTKLGVKVNITGECAEVEGCGASWPIRSGELYVGAAGTVARFLPGALAVGIGSWTFRGSARMSERPLTPLLDVLAQLGTHIEYKGDARGLPFTLHTEGLQGGSAVMSGAISSQFISGLLMAAPYANKPLTVHIDGEVVQREYVEMTLEMMRNFGVNPEISDDGQSIGIPKLKYQGQYIELEPDVSTCCYFWALAALTAGRIRVEGINAERTRQPDIEILNVLERMGCSVIKGEDYVEVQGTAQLKGGFTISMKRWSDQTLTIAAMAPYADGPITLKDAAHIRYHECDRITAICSELRKLGIAVDEHHDGLTVYPGRPISAKLDPHDDHRMAMALSLIGAKTENIHILDPACVSKTCPDYFDRLSKLGVHIEYEGE
jgi:3-phosphoshikimate 1-carboxyvinyltransferase